MKIYSVDFEKIVKSYNGYVEKMLELDQLKMDHQEKMDSIKNEMESILKSANSGLIIDETIQKQSIQRFKDLQIEASKKENEFRSKFNDSQNEIMEESFIKISDLVGDYAKRAGIDMILSKSQLVYSKDSLDLTDTILDILKENHLLHEEQES